MRIKTPLPGLALLMMAGSLLADSPAVQYLSDNPEILIETTQSWGELGLNSAAHQTGIAPMPLQIGEKKFSKGLGHHANGAIVVALDGEYSAFDAEVGIQKQSSTEGSVVFKVLVDGVVRFESGILRQTDPPRLVHVSLEKAQELRVETTDAGDGISCDMADWADARLTCSSKAPAAIAETPVNMARFARVVTWDPTRKDGARASRIEEFRADDLFLERDVPLKPDGAWQVPVTDGLGCIGLQWLNRRAVKELRIEVTSIVGTNGISVEGWSGESAWQGEWKPLPGELRRNNNRFTFLLDPQNAPKLLQKVRWVFTPGNSPVHVKELTAYTRSRWQTVEIAIEPDRSLRGKEGTVHAYNGEVLSGPAGKFSLDHTALLQLLCSRRSSTKSDATVLRFEMPAGNVAVAVDDVLTNEAVYLPDFGLFISRSPQPISLAEYKKKIVARKTVLETVRDMPDQTLAQAMAKTHHDVQNHGPVSLSLACENGKVIVEQSGLIRFPTQPASVSGSEWLGSAAELRPAFDVVPGKMERHLDGGWLPIPVITWDSGDVTWQERVFVAPVDDDGGHPGRLNRRSVAVAEFTFRSNRPAGSLTSSSNAPALLSIHCFSNAPGNERAKLVTENGSVLIQGAKGTLALVRSVDSTVRAEATNGTITLSRSQGGAVSCGCVVFFRTDGQPLDPAEVASLDVTKLRAATERYWNAVLAPAMQITTPDKMLNNIIRSAQVRCLIAARNEADGTRIAPWIDAILYGPLESESHSIVRGMDLMGHSQFAQRGLDYFVHRYNTNGFLTTGYTTFGTAWHLWTLGEHFQIDGDTEWFKSVAPEVKRVGNWIVRQTQKTKQLNGLGEKLPQYGLMPPGVMADWNAFAFHFCNNAYYCAALREIGAALTRLGDSAGRTFSQQAAELQQNILRAYHWTQAQSPALPLRDGTWIAAYPSQVHSPGRLADFFPGQDGGRSWCYDVELGAHQLVPTGVLPAQSRDVRQMMDHMEDVQFLSDGWFDYPANVNQNDVFNLGGFSKVQPYYCRNGEIYAMRDDVKPFLRSYFNTIAAMLNPEVLTFWEHFHGVGGWDKTHETGYFLQQTRFMLVMERADELWLAPLIPGDWLKNGMEVRVAQAPTRFGPVGYRITSHMDEGWIEAEIQPPSRNPVKAIGLRLRTAGGTPIHAVTVNGHKHRDFDATSGTIRLQPGTANIAVRVKF